MDLPQGSNLNVDEIADTKMILCNDGHLTIKGTGPVFMPARVLYRPCAENAQPELGFVDAFL
jgi:hypothetical protein